MTDNDIRELILHEVENERAYQTEKWGNATDDTLNTPWMWVSYISHYASKWMRGLFVIYPNDTDAFRTMMIKVASIAIAAVESIDRQRRDSGKPFYEAESLA